MSLYERLSDMHDQKKISVLLKTLDETIFSLKNISGKKIRVAVIMGGYSSERHISVESGRNVYEKLSSSEKYLPIPVFLTGDNENHSLYQLPVNLMLKDNADDIKEKVNHYSQHEVIKEIMMLCENITSKYASPNDVLAPKLISYDDLSNLVDVVFIALHGRPGEDGAIQKQLEKLNIPYNGSGVQSSSITINKYETNEILKKHGFSVASHRLVSKEEWKENQAKTLMEIQKYYSYPFIAKPVDDGCSSAVKKIRNEKELIAFAESIFRTRLELEKSSADILNLKPKEEFPIKKQFLIEELISKEDAEHFLEITGGMLTRTNEKGECIFEIFEASEALSGGDVLSLEEKFLAGEGQNITPARYSIDPDERQRISDIIKSDFSRVARLLNIEGYARIDAFVRIFKDGRVETIFIEVNSLPGMTPATCIFHQSALANYKPYEYIDAILEYGMKKIKHPVNIN
jgi:D-alanine-D-alanine ligase